MKTSEVLRQARKLIEKPEHWTRGANARKANGLQCSPNSIEAFCFCSNGALSRVAPVFEDYNPAYLALTRGRTHAEVLDLLDRTIAAEEVRERLAAGEPLHRIEADLDLRDNLPQN
jgi:hypothetical protein